MNKLSISNQRPESEMALYHAVAFSIMIKLLPLKDSLFLLNLTVIVDTTILSKEILVILLKNGYNSLINRNPYLSLLFLFSMLLIDEILCQYMYKLLAKAS